MSQALTPNATFVAPDPATQLAKFTPTDTAVATMAAEYMPLVIQGPDDSEGFKVVHQARMVVKSHRVTVEKVRKELKADALEYGRRVDGEAKRITAMLEPIENHLAEQEASYEAAKEAIRKAARLKAEAEETARREAEEARLRAEREAEEARLRAERAELEAERARQKAEQDKIDAARREVEAEQKRLADIEAARLRKIEDERIAAEAAERARIETEARIAREAAEKEAARLKAEALKPDREKLLAVADQVRDIRHVATVSSDPFAMKAAVLVADVLTQAERQIRNIVAEMGGDNW